MNRRTAREAVRLLEHHQPFVRATVVRATGSVPGKLGASMIVRSDGTTLGTVGGAALEEEVKRLAGVALERHAGDLVHFDLASWKKGGLPSLCGGSVDIALEYVAARPNLLLWGGGHVAEAVAVSSRPSSPTTPLPTTDRIMSAATGSPRRTGSRSWLPATSSRRSSRPSSLISTSSATTR